LGEGRDPLIPRSDEESQWGMRFEASSVFLLALLNRVSEHRECLC
jgi:hypothetical protein